jgi:hypothetical protein
MTPEQPIGRTRRHSAILVGVPHVAGAGKASALGCILAALGAIAVATGAAPAAACAVNRSGLSLGGIPQRNETLGSARAPIKMLYFNDPQSPISREWQEDVLPALVREYVKTGKLQVQWQGIRAIEPASQPGERFVAAAGLQNHLWEALDDIMANQGKEGSNWLTSSLLEQIGASIPGLNVAAAMSAASSPAVTSELGADERQAGRYHVAGVPVFFLGRLHGRLRPLEPSEVTPRAFAAPISRLLRKHKR